jgi:hypothetical protein
MHALKRGTRTTIVCLFAEYSVVVPTPAEILSIPVFSQNQAEPPEATPTELEFILL